MSEFWIVANAQLERHKTVEDAMEQHAQLTKHLPDKKFMVYRCKRYVKSARHFTKMVALLQDIVQRGFTPDARNRAEMLLLTIKNRSGNVCERGRQ